MQKIKMQIPGVEKALWMSFYRVCYRKSISSGENETEITLECFSSLTVRMFREFPYPLLNIGDEWYDLFIDTQR